MIMRYIVNAVLLIVLIGALVWAIVVPGARAFLPLLIAITSAIMLYDYNAQFTDNID